MWFSVGVFVVLDGSVESSLAAWGAIFLMTDWGVMNSGWAWALLYMGICGVGLWNTGEAWNRRIWGDLRRSCWFVLREIGVGCVFGGGMVWRVDLAELTKEDDADWASWELG